jgi:hypothetical protein
VSRTPRILLVLALMVGVVSAHVPTVQASTSTPVLQRDRLTDRQLADWYEDHRPAQWTYRATVPLRDLTRIYVEEGRAEGIAGDLAFAQAVLETAYFHYPSYGQVRPDDNNFGGMGACDGGTCTVARFPTARLGVRGQIHHLRAYADPTVTPQLLANPLQSPRFHLVTPKGMAPNWEDLGNGRWATDPAYATKILNIYASMLQHARTNGGVRAGSFTDVGPGSTHFLGVESIAAKGVTQGCTLFEYCPRAVTTRGQMASFLVRALDLEPSTQDRFTDVSGTHRTAINALADAEITLGCARDRFCPDEPVTRAEMATFLTRALRLPSAANAFPDVDTASSHPASIGAVAGRRITTGFGDGTFRPNDPITRDQMASFLYRAGLGA